MTWIRLAARAFGFTVRPGATAASASSRAIQFPLPEKEMHIGMTHINARFAAGATNNQQGMISTSFSGEPMSHYMCHFLDDAGQLRGEVPIVGSSAGDAIAVARSLFQQRGESGGFELWSESHCLRKERPALIDVPMGSARTRAN